MNHTKLFVGEIQIKGNQCFLAVNPVCNLCVGEYINDVNQGRKYYIQNGPNGIGFYFEKSDTKDLDPRELYIYGLDHFYYNGFKVWNTLFEAKYGFGFADPAIELNECSNSGNYWLKYRDRNFGLVKYKSGIEICLMSYKFRKDNRYGTNDYTWSKTFKVTGENINDKQFGGKLYIFTKKLEQKIQTDLGGISTDSKSVLALSRNSARCSFPEDSAMTKFFKIPQESEEKAKKILKPETFSI